MIANDAANAVEILGDLVLRGVQVQDCARHGFRFFRLRSIVSYLFDFRSDGGAIQIVQRNDCPRVAASRAAYYWDNTSSSSTH